MFASDVDFRNQFDRSNPTYHGGNETAVPINEVKKVPTSMPTEYDPNQQETPKNESYLTD
jgi:flagellar basal body rod protein FlgC